MYEHKKAKLLNRNLFLKRLLRHAWFAISILLFSIGIGVMGYHVLADLNWVDSFLNASMILGGMGPVDTLHSDAAKIFAALYALYSGAVFLIVVGLLISPVIHRFLHRFHLQGEKGQ